MIRGAETPEGAVEVVETPSGMVVMVVARNGQCDSSMALTWDDVEALNGLIESALRRRRATMAAGGE